MLARKAAAAETLIVCHSASAKPAAHKPNGSVRAFLESIRVTSGDPGVERCGIKQPVAGFFSRRVTAVRQLHF
jgi:hypothetical protein